MVNLWVAPSQKAWLVSAVAWLVSTWSVWSGLGLARLACLAGCSNEFTKSFALTNARVASQLLAAQHVIQIAGPRQNCHQRVQNVCPMQAKQAQL